MAGLDHFTCVACGGKNLCYGYIGMGGVTNVFVPSGVFRVSGFRTRSFVCLHCGYIGQYLPKNKLDKLKGHFMDAVEESE